MVSALSVSRRLLLARFGAGAVFATFVLPTGAGAAPGASRQPSAPQPSAPASPAPRKPLVMLDPGHGGKDPGAIGVSGTFEKHVTLAAAADLRRMLEAGGRWRVELTRTRDVFIPLEARVARAQARGAALFVSMHADSVPDHTVRGASVYTLSNTASDAQTAALARRENSADRFAGGAWRDVTPEVAQILASLVRQETRIGSSRIARQLVGSLDRDLPMLPNPERHAGFIVLKAADIPSVLVEMGFMSNRADEAALRRADHRQKVARAMYRAIDGWFSAISQADGPRRSLHQAG